MNLICHFYDDVIVTSALRTSYYSELTELKLGTVELINALNGLQFLAVVYSK